MRERPATPVRSSNAWKPKPSNAKAQNSICPGVDGILVPGGFDKRGIDRHGGSDSIRPRTQGAVLRICLGLQCAVIEFARNVAG